MDDLLDMEHNERHIWLRQIARINREINALGAVNLAALDELTAARERKTFLDAQNADLTDAIRTLEDAIHKIDLETRDLLAGTFNQVNEHFGRMFPSLFGGGSARRVMTGPEILASAVRARAQPPGTPPTLRLSIATRTPSGFVPPVSPALGPAAVEPR